MLPVSYFCVISLKYNSISVRKIVRQGTIECHLAVKRRFDRRYWHSFKGIGGEDDYG